MSLISDSIRVIHSNLFKFNQVQVKNQPFFSLSKEIILNQFLIIYSYLNQLHLIKIYFLFLLI
jgi:hypothetical protein